MKIVTINQQPAEKLSYSIDYVEALTEGDSLASVVATIAPAGLTITNSSVIGSRVRFFANGGTSGMTYKVSLTVTTEDGRIFQDEVTFKIKEL